MWMGDALGEESVIKDDVIHSNRALSEGIITIADPCNVREIG